MPQCTPTEQCTQRIRYNPPPTPPLQYIFTLTPPSPSKPVNSPAVGAPTYTFNSLAARTTYLASVTCITPTGVRVKSSNTLPLATPSARCAHAECRTLAGLLVGGVKGGRTHDASTSAIAACWLPHEQPTPLCSTQLLHLHPPSHSLALRSSFAILTANPASPTAATVVLGPLSSGKPRLYSVRACLVGAPANCKSLQCNSASCGPIARLASGKTYSGGLSPAVQVC